jgi:hypothetical protein
MRGCAFVRKIDERRPAARSAPKFEGDFLDVRSVKRAVQTSRPFILPTNAGRLLDATAATAGRAREAGISRLVNLVMLQSSVDARPRAYDRTNCPNRFRMGWIERKCRATVLRKSWLPGAPEPAGAGGVRLPWAKRIWYSRLSRPRTWRVAVGLLTSPS